MNRAGYMRFDFSWSQALSADTRSEIEEITNRAVQESLEVTTRIVSLDEAKEAGAMALFGEKYGDVVRMVDIGGPWSRELCAGTHVSTSAEIGLVSLVGESSVGASNRRIEALVGADAFRELAAERAIVSQLTSSLKTPREQLPERIADLTASLKAAEKRIAQFEAKERAGRVPSIVEAATRVGAFRLAAQNLGDVASADDVRDLVNGVRDRLGSDAAVVALGAVVNGRPVVVVATNDCGTCGGREGGALAKRAAGVLGGRWRRSRRCRAGWWRGCRGPSRGARGHLTGAAQRVSGFRRGVRLGIDVGRARVGVARCDPDGMLAVPVETVPRDDLSIDRLVQIAGEYDPLEFVVGLPVNMQGADTASTTDAREFAAALHTRSGVPVRLVDERLSTVSAHAALRSSREISEELS